MKIYDISLPISAKMVIWPNSPKPKITLKAASSDKAATTKITMTSHVGTHVDAPRHFLKKGTTVDEIDPNKLVGSCKVIDLTNFFKTGGPAEIGWAHFGTFKIKKGDRLLLKTGNYKFLSAKKFTKDYISLSQDAAKNLIKRQIALIGTDYYGIEKKSNPGHPIHKLLLEAGIVVVEGLDMTDVPGGEYQMACAPLKLVGADASPARVFLFKE